MSNKRYRKIATVAVVAVLACAAVPMVWPGSFEDTATAMPESIVRPVKVMQLADPVDEVFREFPGATEAAQRTNLAFRVAGPLRSFQVNVGERIEAGALIAEIDPRDYEIAVRRIESALAEAHATLSAMRNGARVEDIQALRANLSAAEATLAEAELHYQRHKTLFEKKAVAQAAYDHAKANFDTASAQVEAVRQELEKARKGARVEEIEAMEKQIARLEADRDAAQNALKDTRLTAPFTGYVARKFTENYETVQAGQPIVAFLDCSSLEVTVGIPEELVTLADRFEGYTCEFDAFPELRLEAALKELGRTSTDAGQTYPLTVTLTPPADTPIRPGMAATVGIRLTRAQEAAYVLPVEAVAAGLEGQWKAWVYEPASGRVYPRDVDIGELTSRGIEVVRGLAAGEWVVTAGVHYLETGQEVKPLEPLQPVS